jgi:hypothetical protein
MPKRLRHWSKRERYLKLERDGRLTITEMDTGRVRPATGQPHRRWTEHEAEQYAAKTGFTPAKINERST